ncbi:MAG: hypothetical protein CML29_09935 [Rhizobiales bacterium]|nr:hypothetical protein [Hyphomicrobiales bacterium]MBA70188.1 hypothetical protein [Hyphomicrobiales bacterium]
MSLALAQLLPEFDMPARPRAAAPVDFPQAPKPVQPDPALLAPIREEARMQGRREAEEELAARHASEIADLEAEHARAMAAREAELVKGVAEAVPALIARRSDELAALLSDELAEMLAPVIDAELRKNMVATLADEIRSALELERAGRISVSGPSVWLGAVRSLLGDKAETVTFVETDRADIEVAIDQTRLRSRFDALARDFAEGAP